MQKQKNAIEVTQASVLSTPDNKAAFDWKSILKKMPQYQDKAVSKKAKSTTLVKTQIKDAQLVAIVIDSPKQALLITPQNNNAPPQAFNINEGWLDDWIISKIHPDSVVWLNTSSEETFQQFLYN